MGDARVRDSHNFTLHSRYINRQTRSAAADRHGPWAKATPKPPFGWAMAIHSTNRSVHTDRLADARQGSRPSFDVVRQKNDDENEARTKPEKCDLDHSQDHRNSIVLGWPYLEGRLTMRTRYAVCMPAFVLGLGLLILLILIISFGAIVAMSLPNRRPGFSYFAGVTTPEPINAQS
jgi:hypothetical protein